LAPESARADTVGGAVRRRSPYSEQRIKRLTLKRRFGILLFLYLAYELTTGVFFAPYRVESASMFPTLSVGDQVLAFPLAFGPRGVFLRRPLRGISDPRRGDLAVLEAPFYERDPWYLEAADSLVRFFTFQRGSLSTERQRLNGVSVKRVVAVPGDSLYMKGNEVYIKTAGSVHYLTEYEVSGRIYEAEAKSVPDGWSENLPLSGSFPEITLGEGQYFVLGDNRTSALDSRAYGPVDRSRFRARVILRYWPFRSFGVL